MEGKTSIVVAHHLNSIRRADIIFVIKDCELVEQGTHEELLQAGGVYADLFKTQAQETNGELKEQTTAR
jgi:ATP-binding cassette subfamily B protein